MRRATRDIVRILFRCRRHPLSIFRRSALFLWCASPPFADGTAIVWIALPLTANGMQPLSLRPSVMVQRSRPCNCETGYFARALLTMPCPPQQLANNCLSLHVGCTSSGALTTDWETRFTEDTVVFPPVLMLGHSKRSGHTQDAPLVTAPLSPVHNDTDCGCSSIYHSARAPPK